MPYCTFADLKKLLPEEIIIQLTDDEKLTPEKIDAVNPDHAQIISRIDEAIAMADAEIGGYCAVKYSVPLSTVPPLIKAFSVEITIYHLYKRRTVPEEIEKAYDKAISKLKDISRGLLSLGIDPPPPATSTEGAEASKSVSDRIFTRQSMKGF